MGIIDYHVYYSSTSIFFHIIFAFLFLSLIISASLTMVRRVIEIENKEKNINKDENNVSLKTLFLSYGISFFLLIHFFTIYDLYKKPFLHIEYINKNINKDIIKNKKEIINDIINENVIFGHNHNQEHYTYKFEISEEEKKQLEEAKEKFDKKIKKSNKRMKIKQKQEM